MLTISMLGKGAIYLDHECISEKLSSKLEALIFLLVLNKNKNMSKEKIISYLWPDSDDDAAKSNLRFNLWNIRKNIPQGPDGEDFIISGKDFCRINEKYPYTSDKTMLDNFNASQVDSIDELLKLRALFKGDFLEGLYLKNCDDFNEMILFERVVCQNRQIEILERLIGLYEEQERFEEELRILNEAVAIEPYNEQFALRTIQIYGRLGNRTAAINYYKNFENVLRRNLNTSPNDELKQLYRKLLETPCTPKHEPEGKDRVINKGSTSPSAA
jgi:DNA-binding SARP family transcriptional activator